MLKFILINNIILICLVNMTLGKGLEKKVSVKNENITFLVYNIKKQKVVMKQNEDICYLSASLSKIITASFLIRILKENNENLSIQKLYYYKVLNKINNLPSHFSSVYEIIYNMNQYNRNTAKAANKKSDECLALIGTIYKNKKIFDINNMKYGIQYILKNIKRIGCNNMTNGSGLSLNNYFTTKQINTELIYLFEQLLENSKQYKDTLQFPGQKESMLSDRLLELENSSFLKTGSLKKTGVLCLAGYLKKDNENFAFVIIINKIKEFNKTFKQLDLFLLQIYKEL